MLAVVLLAQGPQATAQWAFGGEPRPAVVTVEGSVELSEAEADASAIRRAREILSEDVRRRGAAVAGDSAPWWLPSLFVQREVERWERGAMPDEIQVLDRSCQERDHGFGRSYQTSLQLAPAQASARANAEQDARLARRLTAAAKLFAAKCGGIAVFWGFLAFVTAWLDRVSRGYMTWRLRLIGLALGATVAPVVFML